MCQSKFWVRSFLQSTLTESHFPESPPSSQSTTPSSKFSTMEMEKVVAEKLDGCSSKCSSTLVQCWRNWTIVKFGRFVTELRTIGPLSILPQFRHHFTIGCHPLFPFLPDRASIPPHPCSHLGATKTIYQWTILGEQGLDLVGAVQSKPEIEKWVNDKGGRWSEKHHRAHYTIHRPLAQKLEQGL